MGFAGVYVAIYDYEPRAENELEINEGDLLYVIEKSSVDDWWKAKRKASPDEEEEPEGLVPNNYVEEAHPISFAKALYDYTRQTDEEVSFDQDADIAIYDTSDPDWTLVRVGHDYGFAPANYIEITDAAHGAHDHDPAAAAIPAGHPQFAEPEQAEYHEPDHPHAPVPSGATDSSPAAALAGILHGRQPSAGTANHQAHYEEEAAAPYDPRDHDRGYTEEELQEEHPPALPQRPMSIQVDRPSHRERDDRHRLSRLPDEVAGVKSSPPVREGHLQSKNFPSGYHLYNISESVTVMGKKKKMPTTLGINVNQGMILISTRKDDDKMEQWSVDKLSNYSIEGKHVFLDLVRPSKSIDFHAGAKDTAQEIVSLLGEIAGRYRAEGLREVIEAGKGGGKKRGQILYDFDAQGDDEVSVCVGDEVIILDDQKSDDWWMVRRLKNGREGVVPSSYIEITGIGSTLTGGPSGTGMSLAEQSRLEEERLAREALKKSARKSHHDTADSRTSVEVGVGPRIPRRRSKLSFMALVNDLSSQRSKKDLKADSKSGKSKPDPSRLRKWTDISGTFNVKAQFTGLVDGKIHLHKENGVKIAVPVAKMSLADIEYVESVTGVSLEEDKPLSAVKAARSTSKPTSGAAVAPESNYDWFDFFLRAGVPPQFCERYAQNFVKDSMDEAILPDITTENLRTLGLKEGDILRVMKYLDGLFGRTGNKSKARNANAEEEEGDGQGGLFSGPGGTLHNNTRKSRPAPAVVTSDTVDPKVFESKDGNASPGSKSASPPATARGFDDDAWEIKKPTASSSRTASPATSASARPAAAAAANKTGSPAPPTGALADLSLLQAPLQPTPISQPPAAPPVSTPVAVVPPPAPAPAMAPAQPPLAISQAPPQMAQPIQAQPTGANPAFFSQLGASQQQPQPQQPMQTQQQFMPQMTGYTTQSQPMQPQMTAMPPLPQMPQMTANIGLMAQQQPPRPLSAPQNPPQPVSAFGPMTPLQPQVTGAPGPNMAFPQRQQPPPPPPPFQPRSAFGNAIVAQQTGMPPQQPQSQFGMQQPGGFQIQPTGFQPQPTGFQSVLQPQPTGFSIPPPPIPSQPTTLPLTPQKTGPPPPVRFGVPKEKLQPQPTGLRANLAQATPSNPFGF